MKDNTDSKLLLGAHMSIAGGIDKAIDRGLEIGCTAIQIFTASNRSWSTKEMDFQEIEAVKIKQKEANIPIVSHCSYLINLASTNAFVCKQSRNALIHELRRCDALGINHAVLHPGSKLESTEGIALKQVAQLLDEVIEESETKTTILLETMAGQGTTIGNTFEQLAFIRSATKHKNLLGICADTCHLFAQGYAFSTQEEHKSLWQSFDEIVGLQHLKVLHLNDSKKGCGEKTDRHEHIGSGKIGLEAFSYIMNEPRFATIIKIIETPKGSLEDDRANLEKLKRLIK